MKLLTLTYLLPLRFIIADQLGALLVILVGTQILADMSAFLPLMGFLPLPKSVRW